MQSCRVRSRAAALAGVLALALSAPLAAQGKGYSLDDILGLVRRHVASARVLSLAKSSCLTFVVTNEAATRIKRAGGTQALVDGLRQVCNPNTPAVDSVAKTPPPPPPVDTAITVRLRAAVVGSDLTVRALPQLDLWIISPRGDTTRVSTDREHAGIRAERRALPVGAVPDVREGCRDDRADAEECAGGNHPRRSHHQRRRARQRGARQHRQGFRIAGAAAEEGAHGKGVVRRLQVGTVHGVRQPAR